MNPQDILDLLDEIYALYSNPDYEFTVEQATSRPLEEAEIKVAMAY